MKTFGQNLSFFRKQKNLNQVELAIKLDTTQQRISEWECNKIEPTLFNIIKILAVLEISFEELTEGIQN